MGPKIENENQCRKKKKIFFFVCCTVQHICFGIHFYLFIFSRIKLLSDPLELVTALFPKVTTKSTRKAQILLITVWLLPKFWTFIFHINFSAFLVDQWCWSLLHIIACLSTITWILLRFVLAKNAIIIFMSRRPLPLSMPPFSRRHLGTNTKLHSKTFRKIDMRVHNIPITACEFVYWNRRDPAASGSGVSEKCRGNTSKCIEVLCCQIRSTRYLFSASAHKNALDIQMCDFACLAMQTERTGTRAHSKLPFYTILLLWMTFICLCFYLCALYLSLPHSFWFVGSGILPALFRWLCCR